MEEDWGLEAIVRACSHDHYTTNITSSVLDHDIYRDHLFYDFPEFEELQNKNAYSVIVDGLHDLYKPLCDPIPSTIPHLEHSDCRGNQLKLEQEDMNKLLEENANTLVAKPKALTPPAPKYKRKNQQKRVVVQVTAQGLSSDLWAWRKYGQKPIKGSPYPRSYYRCSSSKGCLARRQVEESCSDPGMFIVTYSAEHNHAKPTRRSSLAGTIRQKFTAALKRTSSDESCVSSVHVDQVQALNKIKHEIDEQSIRHDAGDHDREFVIPDSILTEDFFEAFDDLGGLVSNSSSYACSSQ